MLTYCFKDFLNYCPQAHACDEYFKMSLSRIIVAKKSRSWEITQMLNFMLS